MVSARLSLRVRSSLVVLCLLILPPTACAAPPGGTAWGDGATVAPGWRRLGEAALKAATDPFTWAPALGAAALQIGNLDNRISRWANRHNPVFGSRAAAADASDMLDEANVAIYLGTGLAAPVSGSDNWVWTKTKGFAVGAAAIFATAGTTAGLKDLSQRQRPVGRGNQSFPSGHASLAGVTDRLSYENLRYYNLTPAARVMTDTGLASLSLMTGWARVEAGKHHPADVLAGAALGNFFAVFANEAFLRPKFGNNVAINIGPNRDGWEFYISYAY
jgi:membrane-associated phospholipid phosphatase